MKSGPFQKSIRCAIFKPAIFLINPVTWVFFLKIKISNVKIVVSKVSILVSFNL